MSSTSGTAVFGEAVASSGVTIGVYGDALSDDGIGVYGSALTTGGDARGVMGEVVGVLGYAGYFENTSTAAAPNVPTAVWAKSYSANGVGLKATSGSAGATGSDVAVLGDSYSNTGVGVFGLSRSTGAAGHGVKGVSFSTSSGAGVYGDAVGSSGTNYGVYGRTNSSSGYAGYFAQNVHCNGTFTASVKNFKIDHPVDPGNMFLSHACVESPEMLNIYSGVAEVDAGGNAWIELPEYFESLNTDFRYQLTSIGGPAPLLHVASEIVGNGFRVSGGMPGCRVSWQVAGIRKDAYALAHPILVEEPKSLEDRGRYLHPELFGAPNEEGLHFLPADFGFADQAE